MPLTAVLDHVAVAVPDLAAAVAQWRELGAGEVNGWQFEVFTFEQVRFGGEGKLELLAASPRDKSEGNFVRRFLARYGVQIHHVTLKVADLGAALRVLEADGLQLVDVQQTDAHWREAFLSPRQVGGLVVQIAWTDLSDQEWARRGGHADTPPRADAPTLLGPTLRHPDLDAAARLWRLVGADVVDEGGVLRCRWPGSPLDVEVRRGDPAGPIALRFDERLKTPPPLAPPVEVARLSPRA